MNKKHIKSQSVTMVARTRRVKDLNAAVGLFNKHRKPKKATKPKPCNSYTQDVQIMTGRQRLKHRGSRQTRYTWNKSGTNQQEILQTTTKTQELL